MDSNQLGAFLRLRRAKLDPGALGFAPERRRTPGLRREEVAQRASISSTWYTCLEQGRGGAPSSDVLDRISRALMLTDVEREHLFLLGLGRLPEVRYQKTTGVAPRLQRVLNTIDPDPAFIRTATWDLVAWNRAATFMLTDFAQVPAQQRNLLRLVFLDPRARAMQSNWVDSARFVVSAFKVDAARAGAASDVAPLVAELCRCSPEFDIMWHDNEIRSFGEGAKHIQHPLLGALSFDYSVFAVDGRSDLSMVVYVVTTAAASNQLRSLVEVSGVGERAPLVGKSTPPAS